jgi:hypothetical protein
MCGFEDSNALQEHLELSVCVCVCVWEYQCLFIYKDVIEAKEVEEEEAEEKEE